MHLKRIAYDLFFMLFVRIINIYAVYFFYAYYVIHCDIFSRGIRSFVYNFCCLGFFCVMIIMMVYFSFFHAHKIIPLPPLLTILLTHK